MLAGAWSRGLALAPDGSLASFSPNYPECGRPGESDNGVKRRSEDFRSPQSHLFPKKLQLRLLVWPWYFYISAASILSAELAWECFPLFQALSSCWVTAVFKDDL